MQIKEYLEKYQPTIYKTFVNALHNEKLSHAYLISGNPGMPLKETALYLAKSILCDSPNPLACNSCITCVRIDEGNYPDVMVFDGEKDRIKKGDIERIITNFDKTALESKGIMIYVLHLVETMTPIAVNSLLKFLEEPGKNIFAFLTTENEAKVLPTIISRTQVFRLKAINVKKIINDAVSAGVFQEDAELLSIFYNDPESIKNNIEEENFVIAKQALNDQLNAMLMSRDDAIFTCQRLVEPKMKSGIVTRMYLKLLSQVFQDLNNLQVNGEIIFTCYANIYEGLLEKLKNLDKSLLVIMSSMKKLELNVNTSLLLDHIIFEITKGAK
ncbi:MAG: DNA polymerase III subunit delta [Bacilli bacterium]|nr:DNA polymerase III subunit delta [Bacilli bacterium]